MKDLFSSFSRFKRPASLEITNGFTIDANTIRNQLGQLERQVSCVSQMQTYACEVDSTLIFWASWHKDFIESMHMMINLKKGDKEVILRRTSLSLDQDAKIQLLINCWADPAIFHELVNARRYPIFSQLSRQCIMVLRCYSLITRYIDAATYRKLMQRNLAAFRMQMGRILMHYRADLYCAYVKSAGGDIEKALQIDTDLIPDFVESRVEADYRGVINRAQRLAILPYRDDATMKYLAPVMEVLLRQVCKGPVLTFGRKADTIPIMAQEGITASILDQSLIDKYIDLLSEVRDPIPEDKVFATCVGQTYAPEVFAQYRNIQIIMDYLSDTLIACEKTGQRIMTDCAKDMIQQSPARTKFAAAAANLNVSNTSGGMKDGKTAWFDTPDSEGGSQTNSIVTTNFIRRAPAHGREVDADQFMSTMEAWIEQCRVNPKMELGIRIRQSRGGLLKNNKVDCSIGLEALGVSSDLIDEAAETSMSLLSDACSGIRSMENAYMIVFPSNSMFGSPVEIDWSIASEINRLQGYSFEYWRCRKHFQEIRAKRHSSGSPNISRENSSSNRASSDSPETAAPNSEFDTIADSVLQSMRSPSAPDGIEVDLECAAKSDEVDFDSFQRISPEDEPRKATVQFGASGAFLSRVRNRTSVTPQPSMAARSTNKPESDD